MLLITVLLVKLNLIEKLLGIVLVTVVILKMLTQNLVLLWLLVITNVVLVI